MRIRIEIAYAVAAYVIWGMLPIFWKSLETIPAAEIICHRMIWSALFVVFLTGYRYRWQWLRRAVANPVTLIASFLTASLLALNWLVYVWAVNSGHIVESSLGYFINPLFTVLLGVIFLKERPRPLQWTAIFIAASGIIYMTVAYGSFPWIALTLATTFGFYSLLRKTGLLSSLQGLSLETAILFLPALAFLVYFEQGGSGSFGHAGTSLNLLLILTGIATVLPLILFVSAARKISLMNIGVLQYLAPTMQFLIGVFLYDEVFTRDRLIGFVIIWIALCIYSVEGIVVARRRRGISVGANSVVRQAKPAHEQPRQDQICLDRRLTAWYELGWLPITERRYR